MQIPRKTLLMTLSIWLLTCAAVSQAEAKQHRFSAKTTGSFVSTNIDTNQDGAPGSLFSLQGRSSLGKISVELLAEFFFGPPTGACEINMIEGTLEVARAVVRVNAGKGDLIYLESTSGTLCIDPVEQTFSRENAPISVIGGTGRFANATGELTADFAGEFLVSDPMMHSFGSVVSTLEGNITIP